MFVGYLFLFCVGFYVLKRFVWDALLFPEDSDSKELRGVREEVEDVRHESSEMEEIVVLRKEQKIMESKIQDSEDQLTKMENM